MPNGQTDKTLIDLARPQSRYNCISRKGFKANLEPFPVDRADNKCLADRSAYPGGLGQVECVHQNLIVLLDAKYTIAGLEAELFGETQFQFIVSIRDIKTISLTFSRMAW